MEGLGTRTVGSQGHQVTGEAVILGEEPYTYTFLSLPSGTTVQICGRCGGAGALAHFGHVYSGECFECAWRGWTGKQHATLAAAVKVVEARGKSRARAALKRETAQTAKEAEHAAWAAQHEALVEQLAEYTEARGLLGELAVRSTWQPLSERQVEVVVKMIAEEVEHEQATARRAELSRYAAEVGAKKVTVTGKVIVAKSIEGQYGYSLFVIIAGQGEQEGVTVKMFTTAASAFEHCEQGVVVSVTGTVKAHEEYQGAKQTVFIRPTVVPVTLATQEA